MDVLIFFGCWVVERERERMKKKTKRWGERGRRDKLFNGIMYLYILTGFRKLVITLFSCQKCPKLIN